MCEYKPAMRRKNGACAGVRVVEFRVTSSDTFASRMLFAAFSRLSVRLVEHLSRVSCSLSLY
jgi:hypothetical protein